MVVDGIGVNSDTDATSLVGEADVIPAAHLALAPHGPSATGARAIIAEWR